MLLENSNLRSAGGRIVGHLLPHLLALTHASLSSFVDQDGLVDLLPHSGGVRLWSVCVEMCVVNPKEDTASNGSHQAEPQEDGSSNGSAVVSVCQGRVEVFASDLCGVRVFC